MASLDDTTPKIACEVRRIGVAQIGAHSVEVEIYGAYANRARKLYRSEDGEVCVQVVDPEPVSASQASWARLLRQVFEVDPLTCPQCQPDYVWFS